MKLSSFLSASATILLAAAATEEPSLYEVLQNFNTGFGMQDLGLDGVLRSLNPAHDTVIDYVQLSESQITEFLAHMGMKPNVMAGVDGRRVTSDAQLWAVPDDIPAREPNAPTSDAKIPRELSVHQKRQECLAGMTCNQIDDCYEWNCRQCIHAHECIGGPQGCVTSPNGKCAWQMK